MDSHRILSTRLSVLLPAMDGEAFERFWLLFFNSGIHLNIPRGGSFERLRVRMANKYGTSGHTQKGIDLRIEMERKTEIAAQCKRHKSWTAAQTRTAIEEGKKYQAQHYLLILACEASPEVHDVIRGAPGWEVWDVDRICAELRLNVPADMLHRVLAGILPEEEISRFAPFATTALRNWMDYFDRFKSIGLHHDWKLVGREAELKELHTFISAKGLGAKQVLLVTAPGGIGKTRLLRGLGETFSKKHRKTRLLFFDYTSRDRTWPALLDGPAVVVVDDAHRLEQVSRELLAHVRAQKDARLILVARPQGEAALRSKLRETGWGKEHIASLKILKLKRADLRLLAGEALGPKFVRYAEQLTSLTKDCPLLTVLAGEMVQKGVLEWGQWSGEEEFRRIVFARFEEENLESLPESQRMPAAELLRVLAMLAPARADGAFFAKAAECLGLRETEVESLLLKLQEAELVVGGNETARILPDLFGDFLVYNACFDEQKRRSLLTQKVLSAYDGARPVLLRNLAEAAWIDSRGEERAAEVLAPLLQREIQEFGRASFYDRSNIVERWSSVAIFLPRQALDLAKLALQLSTAPPAAPSELGLRVPTDMDCHDEVLMKLPALLEPVAVSHAKYQTEALDFLLNLGLRSIDKARWQEVKHPWTVVARVGGFAANKFLDVSHAVMKWLGQIVTRPEIIAELERPSSLLRTLIAPFFAKTYEWHENKRDGINLSLVIHTNAVPIGVVPRKAAAKLTATEKLIQSANGLRASALALLGKLAEIINWLGAFSVISALEEVTEPILRLSKDEKELDKAWRPIRRAGLAHLKTILDRHNHVLVRFRIRQRLRHLIHYEDDAVFRRDCERLLPEVRDDLALRVCIVVFSHAYDEFQTDFENELVSEVGAADRRWSTFITQVAEEVITAQPTAAGLADFLATLAHDMERTGFSPSFTALLAEILTRSPALVEALIPRLLATGAPTSLSRSVPFLAGHTGLDASRLKIWRLAVETNHLDILRSVVSALCWRMRDGVASADERVLLLEIADKAEVPLAQSMLEALRQMPPVLQDFIYTVVERLPVAELATMGSADLLHALAPEALRRSRTSISASADVFARILAKLVPVPKMDFYQQEAPFSYLANTFPRAVFDFIRARILHAESLSTGNEYSAFPAIRTHLAFPGLEQAADFDGICAELWQQVTPPPGRQQSAWRRLFQAAILPHETRWLPLLEQSVVTAPSIEALTDLIDLIHFDGSLIAFRQPQLVRAILTRAESLGGIDGKRRMQSSLYHASGPMMRGYTNGQSDHGDYVLAEARKALKRDSSDPALVEFYQFAISAEERDIEDHRRDYENRRNATLDSLDD